MTLRHRLLVALVALLVALMVTAVTVLGVLRASLRSQLDQQVSAQARELIATSAGAPPVDRTRLPQIRTGEGNANLPAIPERLVAGNATTGDAPFRPFDATVTGSHYRAIAVRLEGGRLVVASASKAIVVQTEQRVLLAFGGTGAGIVVVLVAVMVWLERFGLRPIEQVAAASRAMLDGNLSARVVRSNPKLEAGRLARAFNLMADQRQRTQGQLQQFVADASHELRTPLTTIGGVLELLQGGRLQGPEAAEAIDRARQEAHRMAQLIDELLTLTKLDTGQSWDLVEVDLARLVDSCWVNMSVVHPGRVVEFDLTEDCIADADGPQLRQAVNNLLANAMRHTVGVVRIVVRSDESEAVLTVADDGPGLTAEQAARIFDRFYRTDVARRRDLGGTGLGLAISKAAVEANGGTMAVTSSPAGGSTFEVRLPISRKVQA